jgi:hypothetical protein
MPVHTETRAQLCDPAHEFQRETHAATGFARAQETTAQGGLLLLPPGAESYWVTVEGFAARDDLDAFVQIGGRANLRAESETVEQLRSQFAFFRVARTDEDELGRMFDGHAFTLDAVAPRSRHVEQ